MAKPPERADLKDYRQWLVAAEQKSQEDFDKTVLSLSGGGLGISFVFLKDVVGVARVVHPYLLLTAWIAWGLSTFAVLASFYFSHLALRRAISQVDDGTIHNGKPGGAYARITSYLNAVGAVLFFVGVCFITMFAGTNFALGGKPDVKTEAAAPVSAAAEATKPSASTKDRHDAKAPSN